MELYGMHFNYAGTSSRTYAGGFYIGNIDEPRLTSVSGSANIVTLFNRRVKARHYIDTDWDDSPLEFSMEIIADDEQPLTLENQRLAKKWLFHRDGFKKLFIDMDDDCDHESYETVDDTVVRTYLNCIFINPEKIETDSGIIGYKVDVICDSPAGWQETITKTITVPSSKIFSITIDSDMHEYVYPKVTIEMGSSGGTLSIVNNTDSSSRLTTFANLGVNATFVMDGRTNLITGNNYAKFVNKHFIRLLDGQNNFSVTGDLKYITFEWQNRRYL